MIVSFARRFVAAGLGMSATLALALSLSGCGGESSTESVVVTEPGASVPVAGTSSAAPATTPGAATAPADTAKPATAPAAKAEGFGSIKGQVVFGSNAPPEEIQIEQGKAPKDPTVCAKDAPIKSERLVVDGATKGVKNVLVYLSKVDAASVHPDAKAAASKAEVLFDQEKCVFVPHVLAVMAGTKIELKSSDPVNHNVNVRFKANAPFNSLLAAHQQLPYTPASPERLPAQVTCDIHPWMLAWWLVLDHPYYAVTDAQGHFEIKNVPAGPHKLVVWQEAATFVTSPQGEEISVPANSAAEKTFTIDPGKIKK